MTVEMGGGELGGKIGKLRWWVFTTKFETGKRKEGHLLWYKRERVGMLFSPRKGASPHNWWRKIWDKIWKGEKLRALVFWKEVRVGPLRETEKANEQETQTKNSSQLFLQQPSHEVGDKTQGEQKITKPTSFYIMVVHTPASLTRMGLWRQRLFLVVFEVPESTQGDTKAHLYPSDSF